MDDRTRAVFGIDLGTTYSCIAQVDKFDQPVVLKNFEGYSITPSVVYFENENNYMVGEEAKGMLAVEPDRTVAFIKREMGIDASFLKPTRFPNNLDPSEVSSLILKKLVKDANDASDNPEPIIDVVITCPAYFGTKERMQTKQAGVMAGLNVLAIINEPTAAAIAYGVKVEDEKIILVYDLGGGTFDVTLIRVKGGVIKVIATGGDHHLGGVDWDTALAEYMASVYNSRHGTELNLDKDPLLKNTFLLEAERKKKLLTGKTKVNANVSYNGITERIEITRELFDQLTEAKLDATIDATHKVLEISREKGFNHVDEVLLVGGSSRMTQVKERVDKEFNCDAKFSEPDECVAKGAAVFAMNQAYQAAISAYDEGEIDERPKPIVGRTNIVNVTSKTYGTDIINNQVKNLLFANTSLPVRVEDTFYTSIDGQSGVPMKIFESDVTDSKEDLVIDQNNATLLEDQAFTLEKSWPKGTPIKVIFDVDSEGVLSVSGFVANDNKIDFQIRLAGVKTQEEIQKSIQQLSKMVASE